jgi:hypothetical protein
MFYHKFDDFIFLIQNNEKDKKIILKNSYISIHGSGG